MLAYYLVRASTGLIHAFIGIVSSYVNLECYVRKTLFLCSHWPLLTFNIFSSPFLPWCPSNRRRCDIHVYSTLSYSLHLCQMWVSVLITIYFKKKLLWWVLTSVITMDMKIIKSQFILCQFNKLKKKKVGSFLGPMTHRAAGSTPWCWCRCRFLLWSTP